jgi:hypothetical protein
MKTLTVVFLAGMAFVSSGSAFAGRDGTQIMQHDQWVKAKQAEQVTQATQQVQQQRGLAGPTGVPGKVGPGTKTTKPARNPSNHP